MMYSFRYTVEGRGRLPLDMLRRDESFPDTEVSANLAELRAASAHMHARQIVLRHYDERHLWVPTFGRWESFGWKVVKFDQLDRKGNVIAQGDR